ncbi:MAG: L,D-transpeptidase family protein [Pseudomonadota bacterium]
MAILTRNLPLIPTLILGLALFLIAPQPASAQVTAFKQAVAEAAARDDALAKFYKARDYQPIWTGKGNKDRQRRSAFFKALAQAPAHGLPMTQYDPDRLKTQMKAAKSARDRGLIEVALSKAFLTYARDIQTGVLVPSQIDSGIVRQVPYRDRLALIDTFSRSTPAAWLKKLQPQTAEYVRLMKVKMDMEQQLARGGYGAKVQADALKPGARGAAVVQLRDRLHAMGFAGRSASKSYDAELQKAVQQFQLAHGLTPDGVAGAGTIAEINKSVETRLQAIMVAMERERWINRDRGNRHVLVNLTDFTAKIVDNGKVTFETRSVIGKNDSDRRSPEFSDVMEFMVINPSWYVPRSIATKEYLPMLRKNRNAVSHLEITDSKGRRVNRANVNFAAYSARTFPYNMRQPPSRGNALGLVKFMFPNKYNIYLHDTPAKDLFSREVRAYSHGCIRLNDPFDFAYALLAKEVSDPKGFFQSKLNTGQESYVNLKKPVPVHIIYRTAFTTAKGHTQFRRDIYGRDAKIWDALAREGVVLGAVRG